MNAASPYRDLKSFIDASRAQPERLAMTSADPGTASEVGVELFIAQTGAAVRQIPYKATAAQLADLLGGHVDALVAPAGTPPAVIARLNTAMNQALRSDNVSRELRSRAREPPYGHGKPRGLLLRGRHAFRLVHRAEGLDLLEREGHGRLRRVQIRCRSSSTRRVDRGRPARISARRSRRSRRSAGSIAGSSKSGGASSTP